MGSSSCCLSHGSQISFSPHYWFLACVSLRPPPACHCGWCGKPEWVGRGEKGRGEVVEMRTGW